MPEFATVATDGGAFRCSSFPDWVLLDKIGRIGRYNDSTTARSMTKEHGPIEISFVVADPLALSRWRICCPDLTDDDSLTPRVTGAAGAFLLIGVSFRDPDDGYMVTDVFLYRAGPGAPSLHLLPEPYPVGIHSDHVGVLPCGDEHCLVVVPQGRIIKASGRLGYDLHIFSTKTMSWSKKTVEMACDMDMYYAQFEHTKVFTIGGDSLAWSDLRYGILMCQGILGDEPVMRLIPLPQLLPINQKLNFKMNSDGTMPPLDAVRDVTFIDDSFRFIEMESHYLDSRTKATQLRWTISMFRRMIHSENWEQCTSIDSANLTPANSCISYLFPEIWDSRERKLTLNKVISLAPTLDQYNDDVVYMMSKQEPGDQHGWVLALGIKGHKLEKVVPFVAERYLQRAFLQCSFSKYFSNAPGARMTKSREIHINRETTELLGGYLLSALDQLKNIETYVESLEQRRKGGMLLLSPGSTSFDPSIPTEAELRLKTGTCKYGASAVDELLRVLRGIELHCSAPIEDMKSKIRAAHATLNRERER
ncbi:hypothetical protein EJB05_20183 [Eragrostis curvula]|uniref:DUF1618 domain-containing protein n=1 Tax=Eragrostis curvula TaxID=38414 RepID=A0A5J9UYE0_9POAL|nr:hypothetical protein EJB05_20183 [Eragrostis curvula]